MRHWTVHRNFGNRRPEPLPTFERAWEEPRDAHMLDLGSFAELAGLLNGALRSAGLQPNTPESREDLDSLVKETVRATVDPIPPPPLVTASMFTTEPEQPYWGKERTAEAESYLVDVVYGGVDGLAYVRSLAEFVGTPALDRDEPSDEDIKMEDAEDTKPSVYPLGSSLASWVEQNVVGPLTGRRHELLNRVAAETKGKKRAMDVDDKIGAQVAVATNVRPAAFAGLKLLQQLFAHKVDMTALLYAPAEVAQSEVEWAGKTIGVAADAATTPAQTKAVLEHTAKLIAELERNPSTGAESAAMRNLRLNLLALLRRAPVDTIAMLPAEMVREDLREFIPTLPAAGTLLTSTYVR